VAGRGVDAAPRCKRVDQACQTSADCCPGNLGNGNVWCASAGKKGKICQACPSGTVACNGGCVDKTTDTNCSGCGIACGGGTHCTNGACTCPSATTLCGGKCVNTATDNGNCGACGHGCFGGTSCLNGLCQCPAGQHLCADGACYVCCPGLTKCGDICVDTQTDEANCGTCGETCRDGDGCVAGECACNEESCPRSEGCFCLSSGTHPCVTAEEVQCGDKCGDGFAECPTDWICRGGPECAENAEDRQFYCRRLATCPAI
jgi:hypothetical protein